MTGDAAQLAAGLLEGQLGATADVVRTLRQARLEIDRPAGGADLQREALTRLTWKDLSEEELELCPPLLLVGSDESLAGRGLAQVIWLLNSGLPIKILVLDALDFGLSSRRFSGVPTSDCWHLRNTRHISHKHRFLMRITSVRVCWER
jgi:hypothetical protein